MKVRKIKKRIYLNYKRIHDLNKKCFKEVAAAFKKGFLKSTTIKGL